MIKSALWNRLLRQIVTLFCLYSLVTDFTVTHAKCMDRFFHLSFVIFVVKKTFIEALFRCLDEWREKEDEPAVHL